MVLLGTTIALFSMTPAASATPALGLMYTGAANPSLGAGEPTASREEWDAIQKSGASTFRMPISMADSYNGTNWAYYDTVFRLASERGVTILPFIEGRPNGEGGLPTEAEQPQWTNWVKQVVKRYGYNGQFWNETGIPQRPVTAWELLNEPNNKNFGEINATSYGKYVVYTASAIQTASQEQAGGKTEVIFGGLLIWNNSVSDYQNFLKTAYNVTGVRASVAGIAIHPYAMGIANPIQVMQSAVSGARTFIDTTLNDPGKPLWITELGWPVGYEHAVGEDLQATLLTESFNWLKSKEVPYGIRSIIWYNYRDSDFASTWQYRSGLRDEVGNFRPSWFAFQAQTGKTRWPVAVTTFQANTKTLWYETRLGGGVNTIWGMTGSPSTGQYKGSFMAAFTANTGKLWTFTPPVTTSTSYDVAAGTSPAITALEDGVVAFHSNSDYLWTYKDGGPAINSGLKMAAGTSPSITTIPDRYWHHPAVYPVAFQADTGTLWFYENGGAVNTGLGMAPGTSPAIAALDSPELENKRFAIVFQANTGELWIYEPGGTVASTGLGMRPGTSPSIASLPGGKFAVAFQANTNSLWIYEPGGSIVNTGLGMPANSSPSISATSDPPYNRKFEIAFNTSGGTLWTYEPGGLVANTLYGYQPNTSPSIGPG
jgi:hypothetical protein